MSRNKRGGGADSIYATHFGPNKFYANTAQNRETAIALMIERNITELAVNRFKWENLPESIDPRFLELQLYYGGLVVWYWDNEFDQLLAVRASGSGHVNALDNPVKFTVIGPGAAPVSASTDLEQVMYQGGKSIKAYSKMSEAAFKNVGEDYDPKQMAFPMWNNYLRTGDVDTVRIYSTRLAWTDRTLEINTKNARRTKIVSGPQSMQLSAVNFNRGIDQGDELIQVTGNYQDNIPIQALDLGVLPDSFDKLSIFRTRIWNECMGLLGIDNANQDKKERLVAAEVGANDSQTDSMRFVSLNARRQAIEQINSVFGTNIKVEFNVEVEAQANQIRQQQMSDESNNENGDE